MPNPIHQLHRLKQSIWYDNIERRLLENGELAKMITDNEIRGITSNPSIFHNAIAKSSDYDDALVPLAKAGLSAQDIYEALAIEDIRAAADLFRNLYLESKGGDGYVSLEVSPYLAHDTEGTCTEALRLWEAVNRPNLMIKIPATREGIPAIRRSIADGLNVNVTLIFSRERYVEVMLAYIAGLEDRLAAGLPIGSIASVASFFVSRIDSKVDIWLQAYVDEMMDDPNRQTNARVLIGQMAVANAKLAYKTYQKIFESDAFRSLAEKGARIQRLLWASTSTKNPAYPDVLYVNELIGPDTVNTVPPKTLDAFRDHGEARLTLTEGWDSAETLFDDFNNLGFSFEKATSELEDEGVKAFANAFTNLLDAVELRRLEVVG